MTLIYSAVTANCGNDSIGIKAAQAISMQLSTYELDLCVINCQEVHYEKTLSDLKQNLPDGYSIKLVGSMVTKTKGETLLGGTGLGTFVIYKTPGVSLDDNMVSSKEARRNAWNVLGVGGTAYNKGGVISRCHVKKGRESFDLELVSGHLDSKKMKERNQDWAVIQSNLAKSCDDVTSFSDLSKAIPDVRVSGYDANTRHRVTAQGPVNLWQTLDYEITGMYQVPLGNRRFSAQSTYKTHHAGIETQPDHNKRKGYTKGGMLDLVDIADGERSVPINTSNTIIISSDDTTTRRDHAVVMTPPQIYSKFGDDFERVKHHMASMLDKSAPKLARDLRQLDDTVENQQKLVSVYQIFLSKEGLLLKELDLYTKKLDVLQNTLDKDKQMVKKNLIKDNEPWFNSATFQHHSVTLEILMRQNQDFVNTVLTAKFHAPSSHLASPDLLLNDHFLRSRHNSSDADSESDLSSKRSSSYSSSSSRLRRSSSSSSLSSEESKSSTSNVVSSATNIFRTVLKSLQGSSDDDSVYDVNAEGPKGKRGA